MTILLRMSSWIDAVNAFIGKSVSWLILFAVMISAGNAVIRKVYDTSSNAWLEMQWYLYGAVFMLAAAYTLQRNEHVRIDVAVSGLSKRTRDWIDLFGHIFLLMPFVILMIWLCWPYAMNSWRSGEVSVNAGGLVLWPAKILLLAGFILLFAQGVSEIIKRWAIIKGIIEDDITTQHALPPIIEELESAADLETRMKHK